MSLLPKIARAYQTICEMVEDRGALLSPAGLEVLKAVGPDELKAIMARERGSGGSGPVFSVDVDNKLMIVFVTSRFKISEFSPFLKKSADHELCILVLAEKLTAPNVRTIAEHTKKTGAKTAIQTFLLDDLQFNPTHHALVPRHELIVDDKEIEALVDKFQVKSRYQLPIILRSDPIARYFGAKAGQVMKVTRVSPSAGEAVVFRCVA